MVHVTKSNFLNQLSDFLHHLPSASFIALDEEMTGISLPGSRAIRPNKVELPSERYTRLLKGVPERYSILQVGVALFHKNPQWKKADGDDEAGRDRANSTSSHRSRTENNDEGEEGEHAYMHREGMLNQDELEDLTEREEDAADAAEAGVEQDNANGDDPSSPEKSAPVEEEEEEQSEYISRVYNFYLFPSGNSKREMTLNPSTVKFLLDNHMDFDKVFREGIPYTTVGQAEYLKNRYFEKYNETNKEGDGSSSSSSKPRNTPRRKVKLTRVEDIAFVARTMAGLREWIDSDNSAMQNLADAAVAVAAAEANNDGDAAGTNGGENIGANGGNSNGDSAGGREGTSLVLPPCNAFLRRCLYETIEDEYPGLILEKADMDPTHAGAARNQIRVIRMSDAEKKHREDRLRHESWHKLLNDIGFTTLFQAISDACCGKSFSKEQTASFLDGTSPALTIAKESTEDNVAERKVPLIIHNGLQDLMFLMTHCHDPALPDDFEDTKKAIRSYFPSIFDTKVFATEYSDAIIRGGSTTLGVLFSVTCNNDGADDDRLTPKTPTIVNQNGQSQAHEAGWDAYMTGCVFNALCKRILESKNRLDMDLTLDSLLHDSSDVLMREWLGLNMIYNHVSLFTIDLESSLGPVAGVHDPLSSGLSVDTTFHVSGITTSVSTRDILKALTDYEGEEEDIHLLKYEIIWVDDASFFVGTRMTEDIAPVDSATTDLVASHVRNKLRSGLGNDVEISPLGDYFEKKYGAAAKTVEESTGVVGSLVSVATMPFRVLGSVLGLGKRSSSEGADGVEQPKKRRKFG